METDARRSGLDAMKVRDGMVALVPVHVNGDPVEEAHPGHVPLFSQLGVTIPLVDSTVVGAGTSSPFSCIAAICRGTASAISFSTSSRDWATATQPGRY